MYSFVLPQIDDWDEARAVTQEAFLKAWKGIRGLEDPVRFPGWIRAIAQNEVRDWRALADHRAASRRRPMGDAEAAPDPRAADPPDSAARAEVRQAILGELRAFPALAREVVHLRLFAELEYPEIARRLGLDAAQAKNLGIRGLAKLARRLAPRLDERTAP